MLDEHPNDPALAAKLAPYIEADRKRLVADIVEKKPDAIIVGPLNTRFHAALWSDPELQDAMQDYRLFAVNDVADKPGELWARRDLVALRPTLAPGDDAMSVTGLKPLGQLHENGRAASAPLVVPTTTAGACILALAVAMQVHFGAFGDVSWMITVCEGWLDGKTPYVDFIETNPPLEILLYMPRDPVRAAHTCPGGSRRRRIRPDRRLRFGGADQRDPEARAPAAPAGAVVRSCPARALVLLPGRTFDERDFFALLLGLPFVALSAARAEQAPIGTRLLIAAGVGAGLMVALKPPYAAAAALALLPLVWRRGPLAAMRSFDIYAAAATVVVLTAWAWLFFPAYFTDDRANHHGDLSAGARELWRR